MFREEHRDLVAVVCAFCFSHECRLKCPYVAGVTKVPCIRVKPCRVPSQHFRNSNTNHLSKPMQSEADTQA